MIIVMMTMEIMMILGKVEEEKNDYDCAGKD